MAQMKPEHLAMAKQLGIDITKIDWNKVAAFIQMIIDLFQTLPKEQLRAGCPSDDCNACDCCLEAARHAILSAHISMECCAGFCNADHKPKAPKPVS